MISIDQAMKMRSSLHQKILHIKSNTIYTVVGGQMAKIDDEWRSGVCYENEYGDIYFREFNGFHGFDLIDG